LILDEPTNDLDIDTLNILESYIDEFNGSVITVSHDRYFLDRICTRIFSFEGNGNIVEHTGNYSDFVEYKNQYLQPIVKDDKSKVNKIDDRKENNMTNNVKLKFSYKEKLEFQSIESEIETLENKITDVEIEMNKNSSDFVKLQELINKKDNLEEELLFKLERWEYLSNLNEQIENLKG